MAIARKSPFLIGATSGSKVVFVGISSCKSSVQLLKPTGPDPILRLRRWTFHGSSPGPVRFPPPLTSRCAFGMSSRERCWRCQPRRWRLTGRLWIFREDFQGKKRQNDFKRHKNTCVAIGIEMNLKQQLLYIWLYSDSFLIRLIFVFVIPMMPFLCVVFCCWVSRWCFSPVTWGKWSNLIWRSIFSCNRWLGHQLANWNIL